MTKVNYETRQGADFCLNLAFKQADGVTAQNISGWTILFTMKKEKHLADTDDGVVKVAGVITGDGSTGAATVTLLKADTINYNGTYYYDVKYVTNDTPSKSDTPQDGVITFTPAVTVRIS